MSRDDARLLEYIESRAGRGGVSLGRKLGLFVSSFFFHGVILVFLVTVHLLAPPRELPALLTTTVFLVTPRERPEAPPPPPLLMPRRQPFQPEAGGADDLRQPYPPVVPAGEEPEEEPDDLKLRGGSVDGESRLTGDAGSGKGGVEGGVPGGVGGGLPSSAAPPPEVASRPNPIRIAPTSRQAIPIVRVNPVYPDFAVKSRVEGVVTLDVLVNEEGEPETVQVIGSHLLLGPAALEAVKQWRWRPYLVDGRAISFKVLITIQFQLTARR